MMHRILTVFAVAALLAPDALAGPPRLLDQLERALQATARKVAPSVVTIEVSRIAEATQPGARRPTRPTNPFQQLMRQFMTGMRRTHKEYYKRPRGPVTGYIARSDGLILTSWYNIAGQIDGIRVTLADGRRLPAKLLGFDKLRDVAMLKVEATGLKALTPAPKTADPAIGSFVVVVSRAFARGDSMSWGIVSATTRDRGVTLQIDARTNYGNAGGPVVDLRGRLLGQVSKVAHWNRFGINSGVSYAAKASYVATIFDKLAAGEEVKGPKRPLMGINGQDTAQGVQVTQVGAGGAAQKAGVQVNDVITHYNGAKVGGIMQLIQMINKCAVGQKVKVKVLRGGESIEIDLVLGERKEGQ